MSFKDDRLNAEAYRLQQQYNAGLLPGGPDYPSVPELSSRKSFAPAAIGAPAAVSSLPSNATLVQEALVISLDIPVEAGYSAGPHRRHTEFDQVVSIPTAGR
jgi:hypothetical protein